MSQENVEIVQQYFGALIRRPRNLPGMEQTTAMDIRALPTKRCGTLAIELLVAEG